jgi:hypothetical protein
VDRNTGKAISVTFWSSAADERASRANVSKLIEAMEHILGSHEVRQEAFETVHEQR